MDNATVLSEVEDAPELPKLWRMHTWAWALLGVAFVLAVWIFRDALLHMTHRWTTPDYSHGYLIPVIAAFLVWQRKNELERATLRGSWLGAGLVLLGLLVFALGELSTLFVVLNYGFLIVLVGLVVAVIGSRGARMLWAPLALLLLMIPLPHFLYANLSQDLQLVSSNLGVAVIRLFGISVTQDGNIIDLGRMQLQVAEACNGIRYLFPLVTLGFVVAYFYQGPLWKRIVIFVSSVPITVLMNGLRIGGIGVTVEHWGPEMAEGLLHDFEGFGMFAASFTVLIGELWLLARVGGDRRPLRQVLGLTFPAPTPADARVKGRDLPAPLLASVALLAVGFVASLGLPHREEIKPPRNDFVEFPRVLGDWRGTPVKVEDVLIETLAVADHLMVDLRGTSGQVVNLWLAYYDSQRKSESAHSPRTCLPGSGFVIEAFEQYAVPGVFVGNVPLTVNRSVMRLGDQRDLVWYWFQQRGRVLTNEYLVKWYLLWDALTRQRTDGALVRLVTRVPDGSEVASSDEALAAVAREVAARLQAFVPD